MEPCQLLENNLIASEIIRYLELSVQELSAKVFHLSNLLAA
jgi:hypothetical protein